MKKALRYILAAAVLGTVGFAVGLWFSAYSEDSDDSEFTDFPTPLITASPSLDSLRQQMTKDRKIEMDYYLDRHNVEDEGYEMVAAFAAGKRHQETIDTLSVYNVGRWKGKKREGTAISRDSLGRLIIGNWSTDTLRSGLRIDSAGIYEGGFADDHAEGHGSYKSTAGHYFEGHWTADQREGFGLQLLENDVLTVLKTGLWQQDVFKGERMNYTSERIYGIDISRYQHEQGRKRFPIRWAQLRISHLGSKSKKKISGVVDYPVSFCYIKSTEGTTIRNRYFVHDYANAKKQGIRIGAYHFFSTKSGGTAQAKYFLNSTLFKRGDLPPVLDVEPSPAQIHAMGGTSALFANIRAWLRVVEQNVGVKPILYVGQTFVNKYLVDAPDIKRDYQVWIARYGEYKPDVRLAIWQLCADGRVNGIHGAVDINVFNGYSDQYEEFLEKSCIK